MTQTATPLPRLAIHGYLRLGEKTTSDSLDRIVKWVSIGAGTATLTFFPTCVEGEETK